MTKELNRIIILNLERRLDRFHFVLGAMHMLEFPDVHKAVRGRDCFIKRFIAYDYKDYKDIDDIVKAAADDGFPELESFAEYLILHPREIGLIGRFATLWSQAALLRYVVESKENVIYLLDNHSFTYRYPFLRIELIVGGAYYLESFRVLQLGFHHKRIPNFQGTKFYGKGFLSGWDQGLYLTPEGSQFLLDTILGSTLKGDMVARIDQVIEGDDPNLDQAGLYHVLDPVISHGWNFDSDRNQKYENNNL